MKYTKEDIEAATSDATCNEICYETHVAISDAIDVATYFATHDATREANSATGVTRSLIYTATCNATDNLVPQ